MEPTSLIELLSVESNFRAFLASPRTYLAEFGLSISESASVSIARKLEGATNLTSAHDLFAAVMPTACQSQAGTVGATPLAKRR